MNQRLLCVFAKRPRLGHVKTRVGAVLGGAQAVELARACLRDTWRLASGIAGVHAILAVDQAAPELELRPEPESWLQGSGDLGARMERCIQRGLQQARHVVVIGSDSPGLPKERIERAFAELERGAEAVVGPSCDGGYYLLALSRCPEHLLAELPWSSPDTRAATLARLAQRGLSVVEIEPHYDIDQASDLWRLRRDLNAGELSAPCCRALLGPARVSVVIPVLNEARVLDQRLRELSRVPGVDEVIVVDGGSQDGSKEIARRHHAVLLLESERGRARQLDAGARAARADTLLFLHADVALPADAVQHMRRALSRPGVVAGAFRTWTLDDRAAARAAPWLHLADLRSRYTQLPYGDQALFVKRRAFEQCGGFPDQPLMEDLELSRRLRKLGRIARVPASVRVSGRRFLAAPLRETAVVNGFPLLYALGVSPATLARWYRDRR